MHWIKRIISNNRVSIRNALLIIAATIISPIVASYGVMLVGSIADYGYFERWASLGTPPAKAVKLLGMCGGNVCVEGEDGQIYGNTGFNCMQTPHNPCWERLPKPNEIKGIDTPTYHTCELWPQFVVAPLPNGARDSIVIRECGSGGIWQANYALLSDGSISIWTHTVADMGVAFWYILAVNIGLLCFVLTPFVTGYILSHQPQRLSN